MPIAFAVSIEEPPPIATRQSALLSLNAATPVCTFSIVGLGLMSEYKVYGILAPSNTSSTFFVTPNFTRSGSEQTNAFFSPLLAISPGISLIEPAP